MNAVPKNDAKPLPPTQRERALAVKLCGEGVQWVFERCHGARVEYGKPSRCLAFGHTKRCPGNRWCVRLVTRHAPLHLPGFGAIGSSSAHGGGDTCAQALKYAARNKNQARISRP